MRYFAKIHTDHWMPKNKLEQAWKEHCKRQDRIILENENQRDAYCNELSSAVTKLNAEHSRCKPLKYSNYTPHFITATEEGKYVEFFGVNGVCTMGIWKEREVTHD